MSDSFEIPEHSLPTGEEMREARKAIEHHGLPGPNFTVSERTMADIRNHMKWDFVHKDGSDADDDRDMVSIDELAKRVPDDSDASIPIDDLKIDTDRPDFKTTVKDDPHTLTVYIEPCGPADRDDKFKIHLAETGWLLSECTVCTDPESGEISGTIDVEHVDGEFTTIGLDDVPVSALFRCGGKFTYDLYNSEITECEIDDPEEHESAADSDADVDDVSGTPAIPKYEVQIPNPDAFDFVGDDSDCPVLCPVCDDPCTARAYEETIMESDASGFLYSWLDRVDHACYSDIHHAYYVHEADVKTASDGGGDADDSVLTERLKATIGPTADGSTTRDLSQTERANLLVTFAARLEITRLQIGDMHIYQTGGDDGVTYVAKTNSGDELVRRVNVYSGPVGEDGDGIVELLIAHMAADGHAWPDAYDSLKD